MGKAKNNIYPFRNQPRPFNKLSVNAIDGNSSPIFARNMAALKKRWPDLAEKIQRLEKTRKYEIVMPPGKKGLPNLLITETGKLFYGSDPCKDVEEQLSDLNIRNTRIAIFLGMGLGYEVLVYGMSHVMKQQTNHILIVERDLDIFRKAMESTDMSKVLESPGVELIIGMDADKMYPTLRDYFKTQSRFVFLKAINPVYHTSSLFLNREYYLQVLKAIREAGTHQVLNFGNDPHDSLIGVDNMLENLLEIIKNPGINRLYGKFSGKPAVIVSAGPSLNKNKHLLKGIEDKALILCPDTSLKILLGIDVRPHLVMSLERTESNAKLLQGFLPEQVSEVYLAACPVVMKEAYEGYPGPRIIIYRDFDHFKWLGVDRGILSIQKSGSNMAFKVAEALGCDPIILIGQDLAFGEDGKTHASGTARGDEGEKLDVFVKRGTLEVMGNDGKPILTSTVWHSFLKVFEMDISTYGGTCVNSTEGGAYIPGTQVMVFREAIDKYIQTNIAPLEIIKEALKDFQADDVGKDLFNVLNLINETIPDIEMIIDDCRNGIEVWSKYKEELEQCLQEPLKIEQLKPRLNRISNEITFHKDQARSKKKTFQLFLTHVFQSYHIQHEMAMIEIPSNYENIDMAQVEIALRQAEWFAVIGDLSMICLNSLQRAKRKLMSEIGRTKVIASNQS